MIYISVWEKCSQPSVLSKITTACKLINISHFSFNSREYILNITEDFTERAEAICVSVYICFVGIEMERKAVFKNITVQVEACKRKTR